ncbi:MAG TPA: division/cell wall cluster transcriptional repressor MraZ [Thermoanaerobaculia bacterium]|jgi:MraZ protein|nr:division/cell wall cluster transcriptional repressor MraZ [Thermoanaerobaculia bacterium]
MVEPVLMGHAPAKVDEKGRLKIPSNFRKVIEEQHGSECFITSMDGERALIYPMAVWYAYQGRLSKVPSSSVAKNKLMEKVNFFGHAATIDGQGRVLIPTILRNVAGITEDVVVLGNTDHLIVENGEKIQQRMSETPMSAEDWKELELHGV